MLPWFYKEEEIDFWTKQSRVVIYLESNLMRQDWIIFSSLVLLGEVKDRDVLR